MERKVPFFVGETYHIYTRGVEKKTVFTSDDDYQRFVVLLLLSNADKRVHLGNLCEKYKGFPFMENGGKVGLKYQGNPFLSSSKGSPLYFRLGGTISQYGI